MFLNEVFNHTIAITDDIYIVRTANHFVGKIYMQDAFVNLWRCQSTRSQCRAWKVPGTAVSTALNHLSDGYI